MPVTDYKNLWKYVRERQESRQGKTKTAFSRIVSHANATFDSQAHSNSRKINKKAFIRYDARRATRSTCQINMEDLCNTNEDQEDLKNLAEITIKNLRNDITPASDNIQSQMLKHSPKESKSAMARLAIIIRKAKYFPPRIY